MVISVDPETAMQNLDDLSYTNWIEEDSDLEGNPFVTRADPSESTNTDSINPDTYQGIDLNAERSNQLAPTKRAASTDAYLTAVTNPSVKPMSEPVGTIRSNGRTGDMQTVYKFPALVWGVYLDS